MSSPSKAKKILRRTAVGSALAATLALVLWLTARSAHGEPLFCAAAAAAVGAVFEVVRMGRLSERVLQPVLLVAVSGALLLAWAGIEALRMRAQLGSAPGFPLLAYRPALASTYAWTGGLALAAAASLHALGRVVRRSGPAARTILYAGFGALLLFAFNDPSGFTVRIGPASVVLAVLAVTALPLVLLDRAWSSVGLAAGLALWLIAPLAAVWQVWAAWGIEGLVSLIVLSKIGDTAGYYVGSAIGKRHPFPNISPGKTTAGCVASLFAATAAGGAFAAAGWLPSAGSGLVSGLVAGALINLAAQAGDLFESWVKRRTGVKDSSRVFGPAGGVLDQVDSLLFTVPVALIAWPILFS